MNYLNLWKCHQWKSNKVTISEKNSSHICWFWVWKQIFECAKNYITAYAVDACNGSDFPSQAYGNCEVKLLSHAKHSTHKKIWWINTKILRSSKFKIGIHSFEVFTKQMPISVSFIFKHAAYGMPLVYVYILYSLYQYIVMCAMRLLRHAVNT